MVAFGLQVVLPVHSTGIWKQMWQSEGTTVWKRKEKKVCSMDIFTGGKEAGGTQCSNSLLVHWCRKGEEAGCDECPDWQGGAGPWRHGAGLHQVVQGCQPVCFCSYLCGPGLLPEWRPVQDVQGMARHLVPSRHLALHAQVYCWLHIWCSPAVPDLPRPSVHLWI